MLKETNTELLEKNHFYKNKIEKDLNQVGEERKIYLDDKEKYQTKQMQIEVDNKNLTEKIAEIETLYSNKQKECDNLRSNLKQYIDRIQKGRAKLMLLEQAKRGDDQYQKSLLSKIKSKDEEIMDLKE